MKLLNLSTMLIVFFGLTILAQSCKLKQAAQPTFAKEKEATQQELDNLYSQLENGGEIKLKKLVYYIDVPLVISGKNNVTLDGEGCTFIMKNKSEDVLIVDNSSNVVLRNFKATHVEPEGPLGCTGTVVKVRYSKSVVIEKCALNGSGIIGVTSYGNENLSVVDNYIYNNSEYGILFDEKTTIEIKRNLFEDNGESGNDHVVKALDAGLTQIEKIKEGTSIEGLEMTANAFN